MAKASPAKPCRRRIWLAGVLQQAHLGAMPIAMLSHSAVLQLAGADARNFLQGLLTSDIDSLTPDTPLYAGLLSPQGKALFALLLHEGPAGEILIDCAASQVDALARRLTMFRLRRAVTIELSPLCVFAGWGEPSQPPHDPRWPEAGSRWIATGAETSASVDDWHAHRLLHGLPEADEIGSDELLWLETSARQLHGVSFTKGCYVGQENTARMHHRGKVRKLLLPVRLSVPTANMVVRAGDKEAGTLRGTAHGAMQMALLRTEALDQLLTIDGAPVQLVRPGWLVD